MDDKTRISLANLYGSDRQLQNEAYLTILEMTEKPVEWAYEVWDLTIENLDHKDNHNRAIAAQVLCNLAKSDPEKRIFRDFGKLLTVTKDERFVTARHCLQALWKIGLAGKEQQETVVNGLADRFKNCTDEKNCTLIRFDIIESLRKLYDEVKNEGLRQTALDLIALEADPKYRKKYAAVWKR